MSKAQWNRLLGRLMNATARIGYPECQPVARRWLQWAERVTGKICHLMPWR